MPNTFTSITNQINAQYAQIKRQYQEIYKQPDMPAFADVIEQSQQFKALSEQSQALIGSIEANHEAISQQMNNKAIKTLIVDAYILHANIKQGQVIVIYANEPLFPDYVTYMNTQDPGKENETCWLLEEVIDDLEKFRTYFDKQAQNPDITRTIETQYKFLVSVYETLKNIYIDRIHNEMNDSPGYVIGNYYLSAIEYAYNADVLIPKYFTEAELAVSTESLAELHSFHADLLLEEYAAPGCQYKKIKLESAIKEKERALLHVSQRSAQDTRSLCIMMYTYIFANGFEENATVNRTKLKKILFQENLNVTQDPTLLALKIIVYRKSGFINIEKMQQFLSDLNGTVTDSDAESWYELGILNQLASVFAHYEIPFVAYHMIADKQQQQQLNQMVAEGFIEFKAQYEKSRPQQYAAGNMQSDMRKAAQSFSDQVIQNVVLNNQLEVGPIITDENIKYCCFATMILLQCEFDYYKKQKQDLRADFKKQLFSLKKQLIALEHADYADSLEGYNGKIDFIICDIVNRTLVKKVPSLNTPQFNSTLTYIEQQLERYEIDDVKVHTSLFKNMLQLKQHVTEMLIEQHSARALTPFIIQKVLQLLNEIECTYEQEYEWLYTQLDQFKTTVSTSELRLSTKDRDVIWRLINAMQQGDVISNELFIGVKNLLYITPAHQVIRELHNFIILFNEHVSGPEDKTESAPVLIDRNQNPRRVQMVQVSEYFKENLTGCATDDKNSAAHMLTLFVEKFHKHYHQPATKPKPLTRKSCEALPANSVDQAPKRLREIHNVPPKSHFFKNRLMSTAKDENPEQTERPSCQT